MIPLSIKAFINVLIAGKLQRYHYIQVEFSALTDALLLL